jgi:hypothetical protein
MRIPSIAPAQLSNPTVLADVNPFAFFSCSTIDDGYVIENQGKC